MHKLTAVLGIIFPLLFASTASAELRRIEQSSPANKYLASITRAVHQHLPPKAGTTVGVRCKVSFRQNRSGYIQEIKIDECSDGTISNLVILAVAKASPLPQPTRTEDFREEVTIIYSPH